MERTSDISDEDWTKVTVFSGIAIEEELSHNIEYVNCEDVEVDPSFDEIQEPVCDPLSDLELRTEDETDLKDVPQQQLTFVDPSNANHATTASNARGSDGPLKDNSLTLPPCLERSSPIHDFANEIIGSTTECRNILEETGVKSETWIKDESSKAEPLAEPSIVDSKIHWVRNCTARTKSSCECKYCSFKAHLKTSLIFHTCTHTGKTMKMFSCGECMYESRFRHALKRHVENVHRSKKYFFCFLCRYKTKHQINIKNHIATHTVAIMQ